jgi:phosphorylcholine metabolism protein LicD
MEEYILSPDDSFNLYKLLYKVTLLMEQNNIVYWATGGTFLGAIRSQGIIKWDDDIDLCVLFKDREKLKNITDKENDIYLDLNSNLVNKIKYKNKNYPFIDIFFMNQEISDGETVYKCSLQKARESWKNEVYLEREIHPLKKSKFGAMEIYIPNEYERYFISTYGNDWNNKGIINYDHKNEKIIDPQIEWKLKKSDYEPAKPFYIEESFENINKNRWWRY